jgi:hypothetical protein
MLLAHPDKRHARVAIRIGELNISRDKNVLINSHIAPPKSARSELEHRCFVTPTRLKEIFNLILNSDL